MRLQVVGTSLALILAPVACQDSPTGVAPDSKVTVRGDHKPNHDPPGGGNDSKSGRPPPNALVELSGGYEIAALPVQIGIKTKGKNRQVTFLETASGPIAITVPDLTEETAPVLCRASANTPGFDEGSASDIVAFWNGTDGPFAYPRGAVLRNFFAKVDLNADGAPHEEHRSHGVHVDADEIRWNYRVGTSLADLQTGEALWPGVLSTGTWNGNQESPVVTISAGVISLWRRNTDTGEQIRVSCLNQGDLARDFVVDRCDDDNPACEVPS